MQFSSMGYDIFISYSRKDSQIVRQFLSEIAKTDYTMWIDEEGIYSGEQFKTKIVRAIKNSSIILFFSSVNANASEWTVKEIGYALKKNKTIIPIRLDDCEYDDSIDFDLVNIDFIKYDREHFEQTVERLITSIETHLRPSTSGTLSSSEDGSNPTTTLSPGKTYMLGKTYYGMGDLKQAVQLYRFAAERGFAEAQNDLGDCYYNGNGVKQDFNEAARWYRKAAMQGDVPARCNLGICYYYGNGVNQDYIEAIEWHTQAAKHGYAAAQYYLGNCLYYGYGGQQDFEEAIKWFKLAADQGNADAQYYLGRCYYYGDGVEQDFNEAVKWFTLAAEQGQIDAQDSLGRCYEYGNGVEQDYGKAYKWYSKDYHNDEDRLSLTRKGCCSIIFLIWFILFLLNKILN